MLSTRLSRAVGPGGMQTVSDRQIVSGKCLSASSCDCDSDDVIRIARGATHYISGNVSSKILSPDVAVI